MWSFEKILSLFQIRIKREYVKGWSIYLKELYILIYANVSTLYATTNMKPNTFIGKIVFL